MTVKAYKNHRVNSRKGRVHLTFNTKGEDAAIKQGKTLKLKSSTLMQWVRTWKAERKRAKIAAPMRKPSKPRVGKVPPAKGKGHEMRASA